jgi:agmatine/peptidylarginine deiminase
MKAFNRATPNAAVVLVGSRFFLAQTGMIHEITRNGTSY